MPRQYYRRPYRYECPQYYGYEPYEDYDYDNPYGERETAREMLHHIEENVEAQTGILSDMRTSLNEINRTLHSMHEMMNGMYNH